MSIGSISDGSFSKIVWRCTDGISRSYEKSVDVPCYCKKKPVCKKSWFVTAASHGFGGLRRPGRSGSPPAAAPGRGSTLRLRVTESQALSLSISLYLSLPRLSSRVSEALSESLARLSKLEARARGRRAGANGANGAAAAGSITDHCRDDLWKT